MSGPGLGLGNRIATTWQVYHLGWIWCLRSRSSCKYRISSCARSDWSYEYRHEEYYSARTLVVVAVAEDVAGAVAVAVSPDPALGHRVRGLFYCLGYAFSGTCAGRRRPHFLEAESQTLSTRASVPNPSQTPASKPSSSRPLILTLNARLYNLQYNSNPATPIPETLNPKP